MARHGRTLTRTMSIETRQHSLLGVDLGEGPPRAALVWGALVFLIWCTLLALVFQGGPSKPTFPLWAGPPSALAMYGWRESTRTRRRRKVTDWALSLRWITRGHRPVIALGRRQAHPAESRGLLERLAQRMGSDDWLVLVMPWRRLDEDIQREASARAAARAQQRASRPILLRQQVQLIGTTTALPASRRTSGAGPNDPTTRRPHRVARLTGATHDKRNRT